MINNLVLQKFISGLVWLGTALFSGGSAVVLHEAENYLSLISFIFYMYQTKSKSRFNLALGYSLMIVGASLLSYALIIR